MKRIDRGVKTISVNSTSTAWSARRKHSLGDAGVLLARGQDGARHRRVPRDRPRDRDRARGAAERRSSSATAPGADEAEALAAEIGGRAVQADVSDPGRRRSALVEEAGDLDILVNNAGLTRDGLLARMSDEDWRDGDRHEPRVGLLHLPRGRARR